MSSFMGKVIAISASIMLVFGSVMIIAISLGGMFAVHWAFVLGFVILPFWIALMIEIVEQHV